MTSETSRAIERLTTSKRGIQRTSKEDEYTPSSQPFTEFPFNVYLETREKSR